MKKSFTTKSASSFSKKLHQQTFVITTELSPPKGINLQPLRRTVLKIKDLVDGINITDNPRAVMKMSSLVAAQKIKAWGGEPILQLVCRDQNQLALQSTLLGAAGSEINNILVLFGDHPSRGDHPETQGIFELDPVQLLEVITSMNKGTDRAGNALEGKTNLFPGAVVSPCSDDIEFQLQRLSDKLAAGAQFIQTQPIFEPEKLQHFLDRASTQALPPFKLIAGILPLRSVKTVDFLNAHVPGISIHASIRRRLEKKDYHEGFVIAKELITAIKPMVAGVHIMAIGLEQELPTFLQQIQHLRTA